MVKEKQTNLFALPKFGSLRGSAFAFFEDWRNFGDPQKKVFETGGRTYFTLPC